MPRIATLHDKTSDDEEDDTSNSRYVGGTDGRGGGSGLAVLPNSDDDDIGDDPMSKLKAQAKPGQAGGERPKHTIVMYANGFTVNDGQLRRLDDPANKPFLQSLVSGRVPEELRDPSGGDVDLALKDLRSEDYTPKSYYAYNGAGNSLKSDDTDKTGIVTNDEGGTEIPVHDDSKPTATLRVRLLTGKSLTVKLNTTHTIGELLAYINNNGGGTSDYFLMGGYPPKKFGDFGMTLGEAGLNGGTVQQKKA
ncbi:hypothetical protein TrVE_jg6419 [Triparma verrucosa]|uniref:Uncharacterized protein n=1 Tax=Triparma verrucosa TaxID=1606542 RepID=A0A9W7CPR1_9STRA|nr:hypothetical protein TrVE_jg6419 [Triparma verrucosa]